jgi:cellulose synthase/poly-beta-1,6-N-acetylglucosamine synthase-like glycosyltransferase
VIAAAPIVTAIYAYIVYPLIVWCVALVRPRPTTASPRADRWPSVTVTLPVYNAVSTVRTTLERLLAVDYPRDRLQLLVLSDASNDGTDEIVREFVVRGVELLRAPIRRGKTAAENGAVAAARGEIIVNIDATVTVPTKSLKELIRAFGDPTVGVASGRDLSVDSAGLQGAGAEAGYTSYEMLVRDLETRAGSIVGASGCFYGIRKCIRTTALPPGLSWDFASTLVAREQGYRSVSVPSAVCIVPRTREIRTELRRKSRTMARGLSTLFHFRALMNPFAYGGFALMLVSHKLFRWIPYLLAPISLLALGFLAMGGGLAAAFFGLISLGLVAGAVAVRYSSTARFRPLALAGFVVAAVSAGFLAWFDAIRGARVAIWDPTPRASVSQG